MTTKKEDTLYLRNKRPNRIVFHYAGSRYPLAHRGHREDSVALPIDALGDQNVTRWINVGQLEKITQEEFIALGRRRVDVLPNDYIKRPVRGNRTSGVPMVPTSGDSGDVTSGDVHSNIRKTVSAEWAGDLMTTEEELEEFNYDHQDPQTNYPSKHRGNEEAERKQLGY